MSIRETPTDSSQYRKLDPSLLLVSELEILAAQARLIEIYVKHAKAETEIETARIHEHYQSQLTLLTAELREKETTLVDLRTRLDESDGSARSQLEILQSQLQEQRSALNRRNEEINRTESEIAALRAQILHLEGSRNEKETAAQEAQQTRDRLEAELARLRSELESTSLKLQEQQEIWAQREESLRRELDELGARWTEQAERNHAKEDQLRDAGEKITSLSQRIHELEADRTEALARAARESEQTRATFEARLADLQALVEQKDQSLRENQSALSESERRFQAEIHELRTQLADKHQRLESREGELGELRAHIASLQERLQQFEAENQQSIAVTEDSENARRELEAQVAGLRSEIASKEQALAEGQAAARLLEESFRSRTAELQQQSERARQSLDLKEVELQNARSEITFLRSRVSDLDAAIEAAKRTSSQETEGLRQKYEIELATLQAGLAQKQAALAEQEHSFTILQTRLTAELNELRDRVAAKDADLEHHASELQQTRAEITALVEQKAQVELLQTQTERLLSAQADQIRQQVRAELAALEKALQEKDQRIEAAQERLAQSEEQANRKVSALQLQLAEKQLLLESRHSEIQDVKLHALRLSEQVSGLESDNRRIAAAAAASADRLREEVASVREQLCQAELLLDGQKAKTNDLEEARALAVRELEEQLAVARRYGADRESSLETARAETAAVQARLDQIELSQQQERAAAQQAYETQSVNQVEAERLRAELQQKEWALAQRQIALDNLAQAHKAQIQKLEAKALEQQQLAQSFNTDLQTAKSEAITLRDRVTHLETAVVHAQATGGSKAAELEQRYEERVAALQAELAQRVLELDERARLSEESEKALRDEIERLRTDALEKHDLLENRNEEVLLAKSEMDLLRQRLTQIETEAKRNAESGASENDKMRAEFQAQLAFLQAELSQKEWDLDERQGTVNGLAQNLSEQVQDLKTQLAEKEALLEIRTAAGIMSRTEPTAAEKERLARVQDLMAAAINVDNSFPAAKKRRWRTRLGWKNRWRS